MCDLCGCQSFIKKGAEAVLKRAANTVEELGLTPENMDLFEDCEFICDLITPQASLSATAPDIWETAQWVRLLHMELSGGKNQAYAEAARDIFAKLPGNGNAKEIITTYHQLEQLHRHVSEESLASIADARVRDTILALRHIHDNPDERRAKIVERYKLPSS
ncbi:MAG: hypothetical protein Q8R28_09260 [Dehalococcoidia bacterium]|nr:hypothetical protein [Dehalococcoidia bacterium]